LHLGRDEPDLFWAPWVAQSAPGIRPLDMWQIDVEIWLAMRESFKQRH
jgi:hypothetical protein